MVWVLWSIAAGVAVLLLWAAPEVIRLERRERRYRRIARQVGPTVARLVRAFDDLADTTQVSSKAMIEFTNAIKKAEKTFNDRH